MPANYGGQQGAWFSSGDPETSFDATMYAPGMLGVHAQYIEPFKAAASAGIANPTFNWPDNPPGYGTDGRAKRYQYVQLDSGSSITPGPGFIAFWKDKSIYKVTGDQTQLGRGRIAGRFPGRLATSQTLPLGNFGWIQTQGPGIVKFRDGVTQTNVTGAGNFVYAAGTGATDAGKAEVSAAGTATPYPAIGVSASQLEPTSLFAVVDLDFPETP
jgi:hypothetical protein